MNVGVGTNVYSVVFIGGAVILMILAGAYLGNVWVRYGREYVAADKEAKPAPNWIPPACKTITVIVACIVAITWGWNIMMAHTATMSTYQSPAEKAERKKILEAQKPTAQEMEKARADQKLRQETVPHDKAIESFEEKMQREADKIKKRNQ